MHLEGSAVGTLRPGRGGACLPCTSLGHWQTHHVGEPSHCGRIGVSRSILCSGLLFRRRGGANDMALRVRLGMRRWRAPSLGPCVQCGAPVRRSMVHFSPMPFGFSPWSCSQGASRMVGLGDVLLDISVEPCQNPSRPVWEALTRLSWCGPGHRSGPQLFHRASSLRCRSDNCPKKTARSTCTCTRSSRRLRSRAAASWGGRDRRSHR